MEVGKIKVLVAEDDFLIAEEISRILKKLNYQVVGIASNGIKAVEFTKTLHPDVVLMDIKMPKVDGIEASKRIINEMSVAIVILTAHESKDLVEKASDVGIGAYLTKPPKMEEIDRAITIAMARHRELDATRKLVRQLEENEKQLSEMNATKDKFFSIIAHDLRNPVSALSVFADQLQHNLKVISSEELSQYISIINQTAKGLFDLLEELLLWTCLQTGRYEFKPVLINLSEVLDSITDLLGTNAAQKNIKFKIEIDKTQTVLADRNMLQTIIRNLVSNAIKFTPPQGIITIKGSDNENLVHISIIDTGVGIEEDILPDLFKLNSQVTTKGTSGEAGTGFGLILCREMVEKNNGKIWVDSTPGNGSKFTFSLPRG
jgi:signal transduction histidine kinase